MYILPQIKTTFLKTASCFGGLKHIKGAGWSSPHHVGPTRGSLQRSEGSSVGPSPSPGSPAFFLLLLICVSLFSILSTHPSLPWAWDAFFRSNVNFLSPSQLNVISQGPTPCIQNKTAPYYSCPTGCHCASPYSPWFCLLLSGISVFSYSCPSCLSRSSTPWR